MDKILKLRDILSKIRELEGEIQLIAEQELIPAIRDVRDLIASEVPSFIALQWHQWTDESQNFHMSDVRFMFDFCDKLDGLGLSSTSEYSDGFVEPYYDPASCYGDEPKPGLTGLVSAGLITHMEAMLMKSIAQMLSDIELVHEKAFGSHATITIDTLVVDISPLKR